MNGEEDAAANDGDADSEPDIPPVPLPPNPPARESAQDRLRKEANSLEHKLSHLPKNPYCQSCTMGKMKEMYSKRGAFKRELTQWGEVITCDHVFSDSPNALGLNGETESFVIKDLWSGLLHSFPVKSKAATYVVQSIQQFVGTRKVQTLYSDNAREFIGSATELMMARDGVNQEYHTPMPSSSVAIS